MRTALIFCAVMAVTAFSYGADSATIDQAGAVQSDISPAGSYNKGVALFRAGKLADAAAAFEHALLSRDRGLETKAAYNLGNAYYKLGEQRKKEDAGAAADALQQACGYYKRAMSLDSRDIDTKINYEIADREYKKLKDTAEKQQCRNPSKNDKKGNQQEKQAQKQDQQQDQKQKQQQDQKQDQQQDQKQDATQNKGGQEKDGQMSPQEAQMILDNFRHDEKTTGQLDDKRQSGDSDVSKDW